MQKKSRKSIKISSKMRCVTCGAFHIKHNKDQKRTNENVFVRTFLIETQFASNVVVTLGELEKL